MTSLRFADDIDGLAGEEEELAKLFQCLDKASTAYGMEVSAEKTKLMTNNTSGINTKEQGLTQFQNDEALMNSRNIAIQSIQMISFRYVYTYFRNAECGHFTFLSAQTSIPV